MPRPHSQSRQPFYVLDELGRTIDLRQCSREFQWTVEAHETNPLQAYRAMATALARELHEQLWKVAHDWCEEIALEIGIIRKQVALVSALLKPLSSYLDVLETRLYFWNHEAFPDDHAANHVCIRMLRKFLAGVRSVVDRDLRLSERIPVDEPHGGDTTDTTAISGSEIESACNAAAKQLVVVLNDLYHELKI